MFKMFYFKIRLNKILNINFSQGGEGILKFKHGETQRSISIPITDDMEFEKDENFEVELYEISIEGAQIGKISRTAVTITNDDGKIIKTIINLKLSIYASQTIYSQNLEIKYIFKYWCNQKL